MKLESKNIYDVIQFNLQVYRWYAHYSQVLFMFLLLTNKSVLICVKGPRRLSSTLPNKLLTDRNDFQDKSSGDEQASQTCLPCHLHTWQRDHKKHSPSVFSYLMMMDRCTHSHVILKGVDVLCMPTHAWTRMCLSYVEMRHESLESEL